VTGVQTCALPILPFNTAEIVGIVGQTLVLDPVFFPVL
jgi:hypothetical protein